MDKDRLAGDACKGLDADGAAGASGAAAMSKNQMKKMLKKQK